jgi:hypothetical protein
MPPPPPPPPPGAPRPMHRGSGPACEDKDSKMVDAMIAKSPCAAQYNALEECLVRTERDWTKCQDVVKALSVCSSAKR